MRYVTSIERLAKEEGMIETNRDNVIKILQTRFRVVPKPVVEVISGIEDLSVLQTLFTSAITIGSIEEFQQVINDRES